MVLLVSASVEVIQLLIGRIFDIDDIILNVIGGLFGFYIYKFFNVINEHLPSILKNPIVYNIMILLVVAIMALYMFNLIGVGF